MPAHREPAHRFDAANTGSALSRTAISPNRASSWGCALIAVALVGLSAAGASAQEALPSHQCTAAVIPNEINDQATADKVRDQVTAYKQCIEAFATAQQALADRHSKAANAAVDQYNEFIKANLPSK